MGDVLFFIRETFKHGKPVAAFGEGIDVLEACALPGISIAHEEGLDKGVLTSTDPVNLVEKFRECLKKSRFWNRKKDEVPA